MHDCPQAAPRLRPALSYRLPQYDNEKMHCPLQKCPNFASDSAFAGPHLHYQGLILRNDSTVSWMMTESRQAHVIENIYK